MRAESVSSPRHAGARRTTSTPCVLGRGQRHPGGRDRSASRPAVPNLRVLSGAERVREHAVTGEVESVGCTASIMVSPHVSQEPCGRHRGHTRTRGAAWPHPVLRGDVHRVENSYRAGRRPLADVLGEQEDHRSLRARVLEDLRASWWGSRGRARASPQRHPKAPEARLIYRPGPKVRHPLVTFGLVLCPVDLDLTRAISLCRTERQLGAADDDWRGADQALPSSSSTCSSRERLTGSPGATSR